MHIDWPVWEYIEYRTIQLVLLDLLKMPIS